MVSLQALRGFVSVGSSFVHGFFASFAVVCFSWQQLCPWFLCKLCGGLFQLAVCCTYKCRRELIYCLLHGKGLCRWHMGRGRYQSFYPLLDRLSYHHNSKLANPQV